MIRTNLNFLFTDGWIASIKDGISSLIGIYDPSISSIISIDDDEIVINTSVYDLSSSGHANKQIYLICNSDTFINDAKSFVESIYGIADSKDNACKLLNKLNKMNFGMVMNFDIYCWN